MPMSKIKTTETKQPVAVSLSAVLYCKYPSSSVQQVRLRLLFYKQYGTATVSHQFFIISHLVNLPTQSAKFGDSKIHCFARNFLYFQQHYDMSREISQNSICLEKFREKPCTCIFGLISYCAKCQKEIRDQSSPGSLPQTNS